MERASESVKGRERKALGLACAVIGATWLTACDEGPVQSEQDTLHVPSLHTEGGDCPPCDDPTAEEKSDFEEAMQWVQINEEDCVGSQANYAQAGINAFFSLLDAGRVGTYEHDGGDGFWGWWDTSEPEGYRIGVSDNNWPGGSADFANLAATIVHEGLHEHGGSHALIESVEQDCILW